MQDSQTLSLLLGIIGSIVGAIGTIIGIIMNWRYQKLQKEQNEFSRRLKNIEFQRTMSSGIDPEINYESIQIDDKKFLIINLTFENISDFRYQICGLDFILEVLPVSINTLNFNNKTILELELKYNEKTEKVEIIKNDFIAEGIPEIPIKSILSFYGPNRKKEFSIPVQAYGAGLFRVLVNRLESCLIGSIDHKERKQIWIHGGDQLIGAIT